MPEVVEPAVVALVPEVVPIEPEVVPAVVPIEPEVVLPEVEPLVV